MSAKKANCASAKIGNGYPVRRTAATVTPTIEQPKRVSRRSFASAVTRKPPSLNRAKRTGGFACQPGSHHKLLAELVEAGPTAKQDDAVAGFERLVAAGGELDTTVGSLDGHHHDAGAAADVGVAECLAG